MTKENLQQKKDQLKASALLERELMQQITDTRLGEQLELERRRMDFEPIVEGVQQLTEAVALKITPSKLADQYIKLIAKAAQEGTKSPKFEDTLRAVADDMKNRVANNDLAPEDVPTITAAISSAPSLSAAFGGWYYSFNQVLSLDFNTGAVHVGPPADPASKAADMTFEITPDTGEAIFTYNGGLDSITFSSRDFQLLFSARPMARAVPSGLSTKAKNSFNTLLAVLDGPTNDLIEYSIPISSSVSKKEPTQQKGQLDVTLPVITKVLPGAVVKQQGPDLSLIIKDPAKRGRAAVEIANEPLAPMASGETINAIKYALIGTVFPGDMTSKAAGRYNNIIQKTDLGQFQDAITLAIDTIEKQGVSSQKAEIKKIENRIQAMANAIIRDIKAGAVNSAGAQAAKADYDAGKSQVIGRGKGGGFRMFNASPGGIAEARRAKQTGGSAMFNEISRQLDEMNLSKRQKMAILRKAQSAF